MFNGVVFWDGDLYVVEVSWILCFLDIESWLENFGEFEVVYDGYLIEIYYGWKYIVFGLDGKFYVLVGVFCNICKSEKLVFVFIICFNLDGIGMEVV